MKKLLSVLSGLLFSLVILFSLAPRAVFASPNTIAINPNLTLYNQQKLNFTYSLSDLQPTGLTANAGQALHLELDNPTSGTVQLVFSDFFGTYDQYSQRQTLVDGDNQLVAPQIGSSEATSGGQLYLAYTGPTTDQAITVAITGAQPIPILDLTNTTDRPVQEKLVQDYFQALDQHIAYLNSLPITDLETHYLNSTDLASPNFLFSLPATTVHQAFTDLDLSSKTTALLAIFAHYEQNLLAVYQEKGLSSFPDLDSDGHLSQTEKLHLLPTARVNLRYQQMFQEQNYMYTYHAHIGLRLADIAKLLDATLLSATSLTPEQDFFHWAIWHEIGHISENYQLNFSEITNNLVPLFIQEKTGLGATYWQTASHSQTLPVSSNPSTPIDFFSQPFQATSFFYQFADLIPTPTHPSSSSSFYARLNQLYRQNQTLPQTLAEKIDLFATLATQVSGQDLSPYFALWNYPVSNATLQSLAAYAYPASINQQSLFLAQASPYPTTVTKVASF